jgi:hypothetical protein
MVAQVDEQHAAMVANAMAPAREPGLDAYVAFARRAAGMGAIAVHCSIRLKGPLIGKRSRTTTFCGLICQAGRLGG